MNWIRQLVRRIASAGSGAHSGISVEAEMKRVRRKMERTVTHAMSVRDAHLGVIDHSAMVSLIAGLIGERVGLSEADSFVLQTAAQLHEIGMFTVHPELLQRPTPLSSEEIERVRAQAEISALVAGMAYPPRVARLIRHQYDDHHRLQGQLPERDLLLAGILHVADVFAAVTWPRPYQHPMPTDRRESLLQRGAGTQFHPVAVRSVLSLWRS